MREHPAVRQLARDDVVRTAALLEAGVAASWVDRQVRSGHWQRLHRGVLVVHSGPVAWRSRARGAVLYAGTGAALSHAAAAYVHDMQNEPPRIVDVSVPRARHVLPSPGICLHRRSTLAVVGRLPVTDRGSTVLDLLAASPTTDDAIGVLTRAVRARANPVEILIALDRYTRHPARRLVRELLGDVEAGIESPLEHRYHHGVERAHGLPRAELQVRAVVDGRWIRADCRYAGYGVRVELDGELAHPGGRTDADVWRDNAVLLAYGDVTLRYRWRHVVAARCATATQVATALRAGGWDERTRACSSTCTVGR